MNRRGGASSFPARSQVAIGLIEAVVCLCALCALGSIKLILLFAHLRASCCIRPQSGEAAVARRKTALCRLFAELTAWDDCVEVQKGGMSAESGDLASDT